MPFRMACQWVIITALTGLLASDLAYRATARPLPAFPPLSTSTRPSVVLDQDNVAAQRRVPGFGAISAGGPSD